MPYRVDSTNQPRRCFDTAKQALVEASRIVHRPSGRQAYVLAQLEAGNTVSWQYGFNSVEVRRVP